jgi:hypothetical protein
MDERIFRALIQRFPWQTFATSSTGVLWKGKYSTCLCAVMTELGGETGKVAGQE